MSYPMVRSGPLLALLSALLFGLSPPLAKLAMGEMSPFLLAGLLYLGSGIGLQLWLWGRRKRSLQEMRELTPPQRLKLIGAVVFGGILAPLCLAYGVKYATAVEVSLLLNLETVFTTLLAALLFREHVSGRVWFGKALLVVGAIFITTNLVDGFHLSLPGLAVLGACLFWGIDNNLTRDVENLSPMVLASIKGFGAGIFNTGLALLLGVGSISASQALGVLAIGAFSYGLSLVLFIQALRLIGASRTSTYFASGPFFGMILAIELLGERPTTGQWLAALLMVLGLWALYREKHEHLHAHEELTHRHSHHHDDDHHDHIHESAETSEPHEHTHTHKPTLHTHGHLPDIHHRHTHEGNSK